MSLTSRDPDGGHTELPPPQPDGGMEDRPTRAAPYLTPGAWVLAGLYAVFSVAEAGEAAPIGTLVLGVSLVTALLMAVIAMASIRVERAGVRSAMMVTAVLLVVANSVLRLAVTLEPNQTTNLGLVIIGVGGMMGSRSFAAFLSLVWIAWLTVLPAADPDSAWQHYGFFLLSSSAVGSILLWGRSRYEGRIAEASRVEVGLNRDLALSLAWYQQLFNESPALMCLHDAEGRIEEVNPAGLKALGLPRGEVVGRNILDFMIPYTEEGPASYLDGLSEGVASEGWTRVRRGDGEIRIWEYRSTVLREAPDAQVLATAIDVTELNQAKDGLAAMVDVLEDRITERTQALSEANERYRTVIETLPDAILTLNGSGEVVTVEAVPPDFAGLGALTAGSRLEALLDVTSARRFRDHLMEVASGAKGSPLDLVLAEGDDTVAQVRLAPLGGDRILAVLKDVTSERRAERERQQITERVYQAQKLDSLGVLAGGVAHEFNHLLAIIRGYMELNLDEVPPEVEQDLTAALEAADRARLLVHQILSFSQPSRGELQVLSVGALLRQVGEVLQSSVPPGVTLVVDEPANDLRVLGEAGKLVQAILNPALNGAQAMDGFEGHLVLEADSLDITSDQLVHGGWMSPGDYVRIRIRDEGVGISEDVQARLFEPFFTTREVGQGTGLGLSITKGILSAHGGHITLESSPGRGTEVWILLPRTRAAAPRVEANQPPADEPLEVPTDRRGVLLVEDDATVGSLIERALVKGGFEVSYFQSPRAAIVGMRSGLVACDLLLTDLTMPEMSGVELVREARAFAPDLPAILMSGRTPLAEESMREAGVDEILKKPIHGAALVDVVRRTLASRTANPAST